jgi:hypothetical protein
MMSEVLRAVGPFGRSCVSGGRSDGGFCGGGVDLFMLCFV